MTDILLGIAVFVCIVLILAEAVLAARAFLVPSGTVTIQVNGQQTITARSGDKLLLALAEGGISIPSACGGAGTCGQCRVKVVEGGQAVMQMEAALLTRRDIADGMRLACQCTLHNDIGVSLPASLLQASEWGCTVISSHTVTPMIREIELSLPDTQPFSFTPGAFVQVKAPAYRLSFTDYKIAPEHQKAWDEMGLNSLTASSDGSVSRAYSIANNFTANANRIVLLIRLALPPPDSPEALPGAVSSWLFGLQTGDRVSVSGPFGTFAAQESNREMVFIGGGVGMAPLRAIISDQLEHQGTTRKMSFWYGARSLTELFYQEEFDHLQAAHPNFQWTPALSDPAPNDHWHGETGFIHEVALRCHLADHPAPHDCEYYLCGPPLMIQAVLAMLDDLGVEPHHIFNDDFGS